MYQFSKLLNSCFFFCFQIDRFRQLYSHEGHHLTHNFRPIQPLNGRIVYRNVLEENSEYSSAYEDLIKGSQAVPLHNPKNSAHSARKSLGAYLCLITFTRLTLKLLH